MARTYQLAEAEREIDRLREDNAKLLEALEALVIEVWIEGTLFGTGYRGSPVFQQARAAIAEERRGVG